MKIQYLKTTMLLSTILFASSASWCQVQVETKALQEKVMMYKANELQASNVPTAGKRSSWFNQAVAHLQSMEYNFDHGAAPNAYTTFNRSSNLGFLIDENGYKVKNSLILNPKQQPWEIGFTTKGWGRTTHLQPFQLKGASSRNANLVYEYMDGKIEYINNESGLRQNFILTQKPKGQGPLEIEINIKTTLHIKCDRSGLSFYTSGNNPKAVMGYNSLKVWDANKKPLDAHMELRNNQLLALVIEDAQAVYPITVDPLNTAPDWQSTASGLLFSTFNDGVLPALYGFSLGTAGDMNGDAKEDLIIGAPGYVHILNITASTFEIVSAGAAFIYFGSTSGPATTPSEVLQPSAGSTLLGSINPALFGLSVSAAGDVNGDGKADVIIGAPGDRVTLSIGVFPVAANALVATGKAYIYYGSDMDGNINTIPTPKKQLSPSQEDLGPLGVIATTPANPLFGFGVSNAGDVNGDGYADVVVGAPAYLNLLNLLAVGRAYIYYGSSTGLGSTPHTIDATGLLNLLFGYSVSTAGNVNKDTRTISSVTRPVDDVIVGAPGALVSLLSGVTGTGGAYVFHGSNAGITADNCSDANTTLNGGGILNLVNGLYGNSVSDAGDVNKDGYADVIVGEPAATELFSGDLVSVGKAYIHYGSATGIKQANATVLTSPRQPGLIGGITGNLLFGFSVNGLGDVNCDGVDDVIVGEPGGTAVNLLSGVLGLVNTQVLSGTSYIYYGKQTSGPANTPGRLFRETDPLSVANLFGSSVAGAGDVNGDGKKDIISGAPNGTLNLGASLLGIVGNVADILLTSTSASGSIGKAYVHYGRCPVAVNLQVFVDANGSQVKDPTESGTNISNTLYFTVVDKTTGAVFSSTLISSAGIVNTVVPEKTNYDFVVSTTSFVAGEKYTAPSSMLPSGYVFTTPNNGINTVTNASATIDLSVGLEQLPETDFKTIVLAPITVGYHQNLANLPLSGSDPEDSPTAGSLSAGKKFKIVTVPAAADATLYYAEVAVTAGTVISNYDPALLKIAFNRGSISAVSFTYATIDNANQQDATPATYNVAAVVILPLNSIVLSANQNGSGVILSWQAKSETNVVSYQIERSVNGNVFSSIGSVAYRNTGATGNDYRFIDPATATSVVWYRIVQHKADGSIIISNQVVVKPNGSHQPLISIAPTIIKDMAQIKIQSNNGGQMQLIVADMSGRIVMKKQLTTSVGTTTIPLDGWQNLGNGMYNVSVKGEGINAVQKIVVQH